MISHPSPLIDSSSWMRSFSQTNQRYYYANSVTDEKVFEANGSEPNAGWTRDEEYYYKELRRYRNVYSGEVRYDHVTGAPFHLSKSFPLNSCSDSRIETETNAENGNGSRTSLEEKEDEQSKKSDSSSRNESKDHLASSAGASTSRRRRSPLSSSPPPPPSLISSSGAHQQSSSSHHRTIKVANNFLTLQSQKHANWLFGGLAELIHNASDAGATKISLNYFQDIAHENDHVLEICDNGSGMSPTIVQNILLSFGRDYNPNERDIDRIGCYGVGFKQGSIRIGSTVIFVTKDIATQTITLGILCNKPYEESNEMFIYESATISYPSYRVSEKYCTENQYEKTTKLISKYSFLNRENISSLIQKHFPFSEGKESSGTLIFIQHWRKGFDCLEYDSEENDFRLYSNLHSYDSFRNTSRHDKQRSLFRQTCHDAIDRSETIWMDCSLKEYLKYIFYSTPMTISLCSEIIPTISIENELTEIQSFPQLLPSINGMSPISGFIGKSLKWEQQKCGGAMLYASNCLIRSFVRNEIGLHNPSDGWGVVLIVNIPVGIAIGQGSGINTTQDKQNFEGNSIYIQLLHRIGHEYRKYLQQMEFPIERISAMTEARDERSAPMRNHWIQCEQCGKWRRVSKDVEKKFRGNMAFYCFHQFSPIMIKIMSQHGNVNNERTRRLACEVTQEDYSDEVTQSMTTGYEEIVDEREVNQEMIDKESNKQMSHQISSSSSRAPSSVSSSKYSKERKPAPSAASSHLPPPSMKEVSSTPFSSQQSVDEFSPLPDLYYVLHHPSELQFNWKGEITSIQRIEPEILTNTYESLYAHLTHASTSSPYYTCTSDFMYALFLSYSKSDRPLPQQLPTRSPIIKIKSEFIQSLPHGEHLFNLSSVIGINECQKYGKLTSKQVAAMSSKWIHSSLFVLRVQNIPSKAIAEMYNPFPITLGHGASTSSHAGTTLRQSISRHNTFLSLGFIEWRKHVTSSSPFRLESLQSEMILGTILESSPSSSSSSSSSAAPSPLPVLINEFHLKLHSFFNISPRIPFWLSDILMKLLTNFSNKRYHSCVSLMKGCYKHHLWSEFYGKIQHDEKYMKSIGEGLRSYRKDVRNIAKNCDLSLDLEVVQELRILFNRLKGLER